MITMIIIIIMITGVTGKYCEHLKNELKSLTMIIMIIMIITKTTTNFKPVIKKHRGKFQRLGHEKTAKNQTKVNFIEDGYNDPSASSRCSLPTYHTAQNVYPPKVEPKYPTNLYWIRCL